MPVRFWGVTLDSYVDAKEINFIESFINNKVIKLTNILNSLTFWWWFHAVFV